MMKRHRAFETNQISNYQEPKSTCCTLQPVSVSLFFKFHSQFADFSLESYSVCVNCYMVAQNNITFQSTPTYSISSLFIIIHSPMINLSPKHVIQQYNRTATTSDVKLFHISVTQLFQDIAPNGASIFFFSEQIDLV